MTDTPGTPEDEALSEADLAAVNQALTEGELDDDTLGMVVGAGSSEAG
jgi:hypothetical protein